MSIQSAMRLVLVTCLACAAGSGIAQETSCQTFLKENREVINDQGRVVVQGAGASFPNRFYQDALFAYGFEETNEASVVYTSMSSGKGKCRIKDFCDECSHPFREGASNSDTDQYLPVEIDFAGSDSLISESDRLRYQDIRMLPAVVGAVVPIFNLKNVGISELVLNTTILSQIFRQCEDDNIESAKLCEPNSIQFWNDSRIVKLNPSLEKQLALAGRIRLVVREESSGTTEIFKRALSHFEAGFSKQVGISLEPTWPGTRVTRAESNAGVAALVFATESSIGYSVLAEAQYLDVGEVKLLKTSSSNPVSASIESVTYAIMERGISTDIFLGLDAMLYEASGPLSWPIAGFTYFVVRTDTIRTGTNCTTRHELLNFLTWFYSADILEDLANRHGFAVLPSELQKKVLSFLQIGFKCSGKVLYDPRISLKVEFLMSEQISSILGISAKVYETANAWFAFNMDVTSGQGAGVLLPSSDSRSFESPASPKVWFGFSDSWSNLEELKSLGLVESVPLIGIAWGVVANFCLPTISCIYRNVELEVTIETLSKVLRGEIRYWNDPAIVARVDGSFFELPKEEITLLRSTVSDAQLWETRFLAALSKYVPLPIPRFEYSISEFSPTEKETEALILSTPWTLSVIPIVSGSFPKEKLVGIKLAEGNEAILPTTDSILSGTYPFVDELSVAFPIHFTLEQCESSELSPGKLFGKFIHWFLSDGTLKYPIDSNGMAFLPAKNASTTSSLLAAKYSVFCGDQSVMKPKHDLQIVPNGFRIGVSFAAISGMLLCTVLIGFIFKHRRVRAIRVSTWTFMVQIIVGACLSASSIFPLIQDDRDLYDDDGIELIGLTTEDKSRILASLNRSCRIMPFQFFIGYAMIFTPLLLKTWRVNKLWRHSIRPRPKKMIIPNWKLLLYEFVVICIIVSILLAWDSRDPLHWARDVILADPISGRPTISAGRCVSDQPWTYLSPLLALVITSLFGCYYLAYKGRSLPVEFGETYQIAQVLLNFLEVFILCVPIFILTDGLPNIDVIMKVMFILLINFSTVAILFGQRVLLVYSIVQIGQESFSKTQVSPNSMRINSSFGKRRPNQDLDSIHENAGAFRPTSFHISGEDMDNFHQDDQQHSDHIERF